VKKFYKKTNLNGMRFGKWTVLFRDTENPADHIYYICQCDCGTKGSIRKYSLITNLLHLQSNSCGCAQKQKWEIYKKTGLAKLHNKIRQRKYEETLKGKEANKRKQTKYNGSDKSKAKSKRFFQTNKGKALNRYWATIRRLYKQAQTPKWANKNKIKEIYKNCPKGMVVDHIIPLKGKNVSGLHVENNLQYLEKTVNLLKSNKFDFSLFKT
jgi:hypothetical protein